jgi:threonine dehydratase
MTGAYVWVKHENHQPIGAFKVRGGVSLVSQLTDDERRRGVITASTGNHGQSVAYAADLFGVHAIICVPEQANPVKVESMRALGAEVVFHGRDFDEAREYCEKQATEHGYRYIHSGNEPLLIAGVATYTLEVLEARPDIEVIVVPVGGGSGAAGACVVTKAVRPSIEVIGVQSERPRLHTAPGRPTRSSTPPWTRSRKGWRPGPPSNCRSGSCGNCSTTSYWYPMRR